MVLPLPLGHAALRLLVALTAMDDLLLNSSGHVDFSKLIDAVDELSRLADHMGGAPPASRRSAACEQRQGLEPPNQQRQLDAWTQDEAGAR